MQQAIHRAEATPVGGARAEPGEHFEMSAGGVAFVLREAVARMPTVKPQHVAVADDLRDDAGRRNGEATPIASHDGLRRCGQAGHRTTIHEEKIRRGANPRDRPSHGEVCGSQNVEPRNLGHGRPADADRDVRRGAQAGEPPLARLGAQKLRIGQAAPPGIAYGRGLRGTRQHHTRRDNGARQRTTSGFIHTGGASAAGHIGG